MKALSFYFHTGNLIAAHRDSYNFIRAIMDVSMLVLISQYYYKCLADDGKKTTTTTTQTYIEKGPLQQL